MAASRCFTVYHQSCFRSGLPTPPWTSQLHTTTHSTPLIHLKHIPLFSNEVRMLARRNYTTPPISSHTEYPLMARRRILLSADTACLLSKTSLWCWHPRSTRPPLVPPQVRPSSSTLPRIMPILVVLAQNTPARSQQRQAHRLAISDDPRSTTQKVGPSLPTRSRCA